MHMMGGSMFTFQKLDREFQLRQAREEAEQKILDQQAAMELERKKNADGLLEETKQQMSTSLLGTGVDDAVADAPTLNFDEIIKDLEISQNKIKTRLDTTRKLKDITGNGYKINGDKAIDFELAKRISTVIYKDEKIKIASIVPAVLSFSEIKKLLIEEIIKAKLQLFEGYETAGVDLALDAMLDQPTMFALFVRLHQKIFNDAVTIEDNIEFFKMKKEKSLETSNHISLRR